MGQLVRWSLEELGMDTVVIVRMGILGEDARMWWTGAKLGLAKMEDVNSLIIGFGVFVIRVGMGWFVMWRW